ncbi:MAG: hypothetical protein KAX28_12060, partial [Candidatus Marinimicrobia bacterium]|nr:hypothetical protein [Candidatus Neomarinimicrobiota bacterium]
EGENKAKILIIHIAGFEIKDGIKIPVLFNIRNYHHFDQIIGYSDPRKEFISSEVWWKEKYFENSTAQSIREDLKQKARSYNLIWIHQGRDLAVFNLFDYSLRKSFELLIKNHPKHNFPETLEEWEKYIKMSILTYEAYFRSFYGPSEQYVGGGVDIVSIRWPS